MIINQPIGLLITGFVLISTADYAQTTPVGTATPTTYPIGAVAADSVPVKGSSRMKKSSTKRTTKRTSPTTPAGGSQDASYRQSSASDGTSINNSNTTNYNSNNVTNAPTGVGSNPSSASTSPPSTSPSSSTQPGDQSGNLGAVMGNTGTGAAVTGARTTATPAIQAGSTVRNTSIHDFIASSPNYTTLQNALQSTGLDDNLKAGKTYTVFAPSNSAFKKLPTAVQVGLLEGRNRESLTKLLSYHVVSGSVNAVELGRQIKTGNGKSQLQTLAGNTLTAQIEPDGRLTLTDEQGNTVHVEGTQNRQSNGMVYGIDAVLMPKSNAVSFK